MVGHKNQTPEMKSSKPLDFLENEIMQLLGH